MSMSSHQSPVAKSTTYLTPPEQGSTAAATPAGPAPVELVTGTPTSTTVGGTP